MLTFLIIAALIFTKTLLVPLGFAVLLAYLLYPAADKLEDKGVPRIATNFIIILGTAAFVAGTVYGMAVLITTFTGDLPEIHEQFRRNIDRVQGTISSWIGVPESQQDSMINSALGNTGQFFKTLFTATANSILAIGLIPVYTFLLLFYRDKFKKFLRLLVPADEESIAENIITQASEVVPKYMKGLFVVCFILMALNSLGFYLIGVKYAILFGILAAIFNLIPYLGTVLGYGLAFIFVLATQSPSTAVAVLIQFFIVQFIENNILTPNITGSYVKINPLVTIFSLIAGGMIWGLPGMFMVIPYLAMMKIVCENIESLKPIGYLLGTRGTERHTIHFNFFQSSSDK
ncbi:AI-2E family transporter [Rhodohalobacter sp. 614A]|uniref:AI-2E family transporter n=1 Tax=Rhodohalobacter sp. 614A TaxID=2908649 RepID=UPI001F35EDC9|nr:AI-2E family transporter [Rhodohalobacter sp. 614A]